MALLCRSIFLNFAFLVPNLQLTPPILKVDDSFQTN